MDVGRPQGPDHPPPPARHSPLAIAALITGLLGCVSIVGLVFGIIALVRIRRTGERGRGLAIGGIVAFVAWTAAFAAGSVWFWAEVKEERGPTPTVGLCFDAGEDTLSDIVVRPCHTPHDAQFFHVHTSPPGPYPGNDALEKLAKTECPRVAEKYRDQVRSDVVLEYSVASELGWKTGNRRYVCAFRAEKGKLTRSLFRF